MNTWISRREAIVLVLAASRPDTQRAGARSVLQRWAKAGLVRTRAGARGRGAKRPAPEFRAADLLRRLAAWRRWTPGEDALLGTDYDRVIGQRIGRPAATVAGRRRRLGIAPHGPSTTRCNPGSWRRPVSASAGR